MNLRALALALLVSLAVALPIDGAPQEKLYRIGMLERTPTTANAANVEGFRRGLRELGYVEDKTFASSTGRPMATTIDFRPWRPTWFGRRWT
jgi:hypothetical protein